MPNSRGRRGRTGHNLTGNEALAHDSSCPPERHLFKIGLTAAPVRWIFTRVGFEHVNIASRSPRDVVDRTNRKVETPVVAKRRAAPGGGWTSWSSRCRRRASRPWRCQPAGRGLRRQQLRDRLRGARCAHPMATGGAAVAQRPLRLRTASSRPLRRGAGMMIACSAARGRLGEPHDHGRAPLLGSPARRPPDRRHRHGPGSATAPSKSTTPDGANPNAPEWSRYCSTRSACN